MSVAPRDLLFYAGGECLERFGTLVWRPRQAVDAVPTFTRTGTARIIGPDGVLRSVSANRARVSHPLVDGVRTPALLLEGARTNLALHSTDISNAAWSASGTAKTAATSLVSGGTAQTITSTATGAEALLQTVGTLTATPETWSALVENVDATQSRFGIYDGTVTDWVARATFTWSTGAISGLVGAAGSAQSAIARYMGTGPNGGDVYLWQITGTPTNVGNSRRLYVYPGGQLVNTEAVVMHYGQHEANPFASSLIVTTTAAATRNAETFYAPYTHAPQEMTVYVKLLAGMPSGDSTTNGIVHIGGSSAGTDPRVVIFDGPNGYRAAHDNGTTAVTSADTLTAVTVGNVVELRMILNSDGSVVLGQSIGGATEATTAATAAADLGSAWAGKRMYINSRGVSNPGLNAFLSVKVASGTKTLDAMRAVFP